MLSFIWFCKKGTESTKVVEEVESRVWYNCLCNIFLWNHSWSWKIAKTQSKAPMYICTYAYELKCGPFHIGDYIISIKMIEKDAKYIKNFPGHPPWKLNKPLDTDVTFDSPIDSDLNTKQTAGLLSAKRTGQHQSWLRNWDCWVVTGQLSVVLSRSQILKNVNKMSKV